MANVRPFLLRRGTATNTQASGSFKRRSLKLRRGTKESKDLESDCNLIFQFNKQIKKAFLNGIHSYYWVVNLRNELISLKRPLNNLLFWIEWFSNYSNFSFIFESFPFSEAHRFNSITTQSVINFGSKWYIGAWSSQWWRRIAGNIKVFFLFLVSIYERDE